MFISVLLFLFISDTYKSQRHVYSTDKVPAETLFDSVQQFQVSLHLRYRQHATQSYPLSTFYLFKEKAAQHVSDFARLFARAVKPLHTQLLEQVEFRRNTSLGFV